LFLHEQSSQAQRERLLLSIETTVTSLGLQPVSFSSKRLQRICDSSFFFFWFWKVFGVFFLDDLEYFLRLEKIKEMAA